MSKAHLTMLVDKATNGDTQSSENWSLFLRICDYINTVEDAPKEGAKAIRKSLASKSPEKVTLTLALLDTCMKNCGKPFHIYVATAKFMQEFIKVIHPKYHSSRETQNTVLGLLQSWAQAFRAVPELKQINKTYQELVDKGVEFPPVDPEKLLVAPMPPVKKTSVTRPASQQRPSRTATPLPADTAKLNSELSAVKQNCRVFDEMLTATKPGQETTSDLEVLQDLNTSSRQMQKRVMEIIEGGQFEQLTAELLSVNDELNCICQRYEQFLRQRPPQPSAYATPYPWPTQTAAPAVYDNSLTGRNEYETPHSEYDNTMPAQGQQSQDWESTYDVGASCSPEAWGTLIDLGETTTSSHLPPPYPTDHLAQMSIYDDGGSAAVPPVAEPDPFVVQLNPPLLQPTKNTPAISDNVSSDKAPVDTENDLAEMEHWLQSNPRDSRDASSTPSTEFERFLSKRVREAEQLPSIPEDDGRGQRLNAAGSNVPRAELFSL